MQIICLGTASCYPTCSRSVSCTAIRLEGILIMNKFQRQITCKKVIFRTAAIVTSKNIGSRMCDLYFYWCSYLTTNIKYNLKDWPLAQ
jgi:hypothetical protein